MNGRETGARYRVQIEKYLSQNPTLPTAPNGSVNMTELARIVGIPKQSLYKNPGVRALLEEAMLRHGRSSKSRLEIGTLTIPDSTQSEPSNRLRLSEQRVRRLEQQNAALIAENAELRRQLKATRLQQGREDMMIDSACRIVSSEILSK
jgi:hypothetical protein